jgi:cephalosporin-C deacetylase-like acetyl esterase
MRFILPMLMCFVFPLALCAQDKKDRKPGDEMIEKYLASETDKLAQKFLDGAKTIEEWKQKRPRLYQEYMDMLGLWPIPEKTPLKATKTGQIEAHGVVIEKVHFQSKPGLYVTANVYRPKALIKAKLPAIVYVCGHSWKGRDGNKTAFQDHGFWFANNGYVCIILDTLQLGEIPGVHHGTYGRPFAHAKMWGVTDAEKLKNHNRFWWHSIGYSPAAVECWNGIRAIDYLCTRDDVDPDKIGVTGISGGGAATFWIAAADDRVKVAVPVSGMSDLEFYIKAKGINSHCDCMFLYNTYQWDWTTIAALVAPRPMLFANSDKDSIFPMDANRRIYKKLQKIYGMYGVEKALAEHVSPGGHDYRPDLRIAIFHFFNVNLKGTPTMVVEDSAKYKPLEGRKLRVFPEDMDVPKDAINYRIDETFIPPAKVTLPEKGKFAEWKKEMIAKLREQSFRPFPSDIPAAKMVNDDIAASITTEPSIEAIISGFALKHATAVDRILYVGAEDDAERFLKLPHVAKKLINQHLPNGGFLLFPRGTKMLQEDALITRVEWSRKSPPNCIERSHLLLGRSVDQGRIRDVLSSVRFCESAVREKFPTAPKGQWKLVGRDQAGILSAYAALFEPSIKEVMVIDPPKSHKEGPYFLNVMRVLDIPEALGLLAPTPLTIIGGNDPAFDRTAEIYRLAGAANKLKRK